MSLHLPELWKQKLLKFFHVLSGKKDLEQEGGKALIFLLSTIFYMDGYIP